MDDLSEQKAKPCPKEIETAEWISLEELSKKVAGDIVCGHAIGEEIVLCVKNLGSGRVFTLHAVKSWMSVFA